MKQMDFAKIRGAYLRYAHGAQKKALNARIIENNRWYKQQYTELESGEDREKPQNAPKSKSGYIFSAIANKHADAMDNYPDINVLPREAADEDEAKRLTDILPCVLTLCGFEETYSKNWWYKLKNGTACYGVFWNPHLYGGLGDIEIKKVDLLNLAWQPGICDLQESKYLFYSYYMDKDEFKEKYGKDKLEKTDSILETESYSGHDRDREENGVLIVDCYYKSRGCVHLLKYSGENILEQTEGKEEYKNGLYEHGMYPFVFDVMYPNEDSPAGMGIIDVVKNTQAYIDKLDALLTENSAIIGKTRYFIKDNGGVNEEEYLDLAKPLIHVAGSLDERNIMPVEANPLPEQVSRQREQKINELKEVIGNRDFQQGGTSGGVTAASAISVLQQAGDKLSRDLVHSSYEAYKKIIEMCIELIRQFYDAPRNFRITGEDGKQQFVSYSNNALTMQGMDSVFANGGAEGGMLTESGVRSPYLPYGNPGDTAAESEQYLKYLRRPEFDVCLSVQRSNPFTKEQQNQTILALWSAGFFNPQAIDASLTALDCMQFDGKEKLMEKLSQQQQQQQQQLAAQQAAQMQQMQNAQQSFSQQPQGDLIEIPIAEGADTEGML